MKFYLTFIIFPNPNNLKKEFTPDITFSASHHKVGDSCDIRAPKKEAIMSIHSIKRKPSRQKNS